MPGTAFFDDVPFLQDEYAVVVGYGLHSVGYRDHGCFFELLLNHFLDEIVRVDVQIGCGFFQNQRFFLP